MLTRRQTALYWRTWASICEAQGWPRSDSTRRYALHAEAGCPHSMTQFRNRDFNHYLSAAAPLCNRIDIRDRDKENLVAAIHETGLDTPYLQSICRDTYKTRDWERLPYPKLKNFLKTAVNRARSLRKKSPPSPSPQSYPSSYSPDPF